MEQELDTPHDGRIDDVPEGMLVRTFSADLTAGNGRTVDVRIVPYGEQIVHNDGLGGVPKGVPYTEEWVPGAFAHQVRGAEAGRAKKVTVNVEHEQGIRGIVGHGLMLRESADGFYGAFHLHENADGDKALMMVNEGIFSGVSLEARSMRAIRSAAGVVRRVKGQLVAVALCREPAFTGAQVLAVRDAAPLFDEEILPVAIDPELIERCRKLGIRLPQRYQAHPDAPGTPAEAGTPEDGTRPTQETTSSEVPAP